MVDGISLKKVFEPNKVKIIKRNEGNDKSKKYRRDLSDEFDLKKKEKGNKDNLKEKTDKNRTDNIYNNFNDKDDERKKNDKISNKNQGNLIDVIV